jgi:hypothetical protein
MRKDFVASVVDIWPFEEPPKEIKGAIITDWQQQSRKRGRKGWSQAESDAFMTVRHWPTSIIWKFRRAIHRAENCSSHI